MKLITKYTRQGALLASILLTGQANAESFIVVGNNPHRTDELVAQLNQVGATVKSSLDHIGVVLADASASDFAQIARGLRSVKSITQDIVLGREQLFAQTEHPLPASQSSVAPGDMLFEFQWNLRALEAPKAWSMGYRGQGVRVALLDTGVDGDNFELYGRINSDLATSFIAGESWDASSDVTFHHGTIIATALAAADNGYGMVGVAPDVELLPIKVASDDGSFGRASALLQGMYYATEHDADIINMSLGMHIDKSSKGLQTIKTAFSRAAKYAWQSGSLIIAAAGNDGRNVDEDDNDVHFPAQLKNVVTISATGPVGYGYDQTVELAQVPQFSNYGKHYIDFAAPGGNDTLYRQGNMDMCQVSFLAFPCYMFDEVIAIDNNGQPLTIHGTSIATAQASGVAALVIGKTGKDQPRKLLKRLIRGAEDAQDNTTADHFGYGRLNAYNSVK